MFTRERDTDKDEHRGEPQYYVLVAPCSREEFEAATTGVLCKLVKVEDAPAGEGLVRFP